MKKVFYPVYKLTQNKSVLDTTLAFKMFNYCKPMSIVEVIEIQYRTAWIRFVGREEIDMTSIDYLHDIKEFGLNN